ncbi:hypothetical protein FHS27_003980 [Rhodopirellula rubra]|uniref:Uncharacterized protein n=1 Tax=Aporhodopirellula rubra TaxID=980271 RepID=A0A7W5E1Y4_9BACT|nr:hypothetical protein [Aporhodopirellula rubra]MBB3208153.1 hypothetical protein [Aporhodopirellula rubra]
MRSSIFLSTVFALVFIAGCEPAEPAVPVERDEMRAYLDEHPEMVISDEELNKQPVGRADDMDQ